MQENRVLELFDNFKVVTFVEQCQAEGFFSRLIEKPVNQLGEYKNCLTLSECSTVFTPTDKAKPFIGKINKMNQVTEVRFEFSCSRADLKGLVAYIKAIHPYETPEVDIIPIILG